MKFKKILFRYKERTSLYFHKVDKSYLRMDLTLVKSSKNIRRLNHMVANYELELELITDKITNTLRTELYNQCERIVKLLQQSNFIINKSKHNKVIDYYKQLLLNDTVQHITALDARQAVSLEIQHVTDTIPDKYAVTDKADGERYFMIIYDDQVYLISNSLKVRDTGIVLSSKLGKKYNGSVLDGEYIFTLVLDSCVGIKMQVSDKSIKNFNLSSSVQSLQYLNTQLSKYKPP